MRGSKHTIIFVLIAIFLIVGLYCVNGKKSTEEYVSTGDEMELIPQDVEMQHSPMGDEFEVVGVPNDDDVGFGMGPGVYGSGRHMSEFIGN